jgi:hypothetical protein
MIRLAQKLGGNSPAYMPRSGFSFTKKYQFGISAHFIKKYKGIRAYALKGHTPPEYR